MGTGVEDSAGKFRALAAVGQTLFPGTFRDLAAAEEGIGAAAAGTGGLEIAFVAV